MRIGLREANQRFSKAIRAVREGQEVVLTERGRPIAVIKLLVDKGTEDTVIRRLRTAGALRAAAKPKPMPVWTPRAIKGVPLSKTLREERDVS